MTTKHKGPLSKVEKFYIENNKNKTASELTKDLGRNQKTITKHIDSIEVTKEHIAKSKSGDAPTAGELMARNEKYGVSIMTQEASMAGEGPSEPKNTFNPDIMSKIKDD